MRAPADEPREMTLAVQMCDGKISTTFVNSGTSRFRQNRKMAGMPALFPGVEATAVEKSVEVAVVKKRRETTTDSWMIVIGIQTGSLGKDPEWRRQVDGAAVMMTAYLAGRAVGDGEYLERVMPAPYEVWMVVSTLRPRMVIVDTLPFLS